MVAFAPKFGKGGGDLQMIFYLYMSAVLVVSTQIGGETLQP